MNTEVKKIAAELKEILSGEPWYGKAVLNVLNEVKPELVFIKFNSNPHAMIDLVYHMVTWTEFTRARLQKEKIDDMEAFDALDWREIKPEIHTWQEGVSQLHSETNRIIEFLDGSTDDILEEKADYRDYNLRYLLNGLIQHHIYHIGQIAYINKMSQETNL